MGGIRIIPDVEVGSTGEGAKSIILPLVMGAFLFGGGAILTTTRLVSGNHKEKIVELSLISAAFWILAVAITFIAFRTILSRNTTYVPGKSFAGYRRNDKGISTGYRFLMWLGLAIMTFGIIGILLIDKKFYYAVIPGFVVAYVGYRGRISKEVHEDVDHVGAEILRQSGIISQDKIYASYMNYSPLDQNYRKKGDAVVGVLADGIVILFSDGSDWTSARKRFSDLSEFGLFTDDAMAIHILMRFTEGSQYKFKVDPFCKVTTEPSTFVRQFLRALDNALTSGSVEQGGARRRRIVVDGDHSPDLEESFGLSAAEPVISARQLELSSETSNKIKKVTEIEGGRSLELNF